MKSILRPEITALVCHNKCQKGKKVSIERDPRRARVWPIKARFSDNRNGVGIYSPVFLYGEKYA